MWLVCSTPRIYYHSLRRIQARARCAGYNRHQTRSIITCTVIKRIYASHTCVSAICGHRRRWMRRRIDPVSVITWY